MSASADDQYEVQNDQAGGDIPAGDVQDNDYKSRTGQSEIPVQSDDAPVEDPIDPANADSDAQLGKNPHSFDHLRMVQLTHPVTEADDKNAIDSSNIIEGGRTRGATKQSGTYTEPGDEEGLPGPEDGTSRGRQ